MKNIENAVICASGIEKCPYGGYFHTSCIRKFDYKVVAKEGMDYFCKVCKRLGTDEAFKLSKLKRSTNSSVSNGSQCSADSKSSRTNLIKEGSKGKLIGMSSNEQSAASFLTCTTLDSHSSNATNERLS